MFPFLCGLSYAVFYIYIYIKEGRVIQAAAIYYQSISEGWIVRTNTVMEDLAYPPEQFCQNITHERLYRSLSEAHARCLELKIIV
jgi:hypothetical protein